MSAKIAILGCGPTGLAAAQACVNAGHEVAIYSRKTKSKLYGSQYLHEPIPGVEYPEPPVKVSYVLDGTNDEYRIKVYGSWRKYRQGIKVSPEDYEGEHEAWDIRWTYDQLWEKFFNEIRDVMSIDTILDSDTLRQYALVINTIPRPQLCDVAEHRFDSQRIFAMGDAPGIQMVPWEFPENTVVCSGRPDVEWYRASNIFGYRTVEWATRDRPKLDGRYLPAAPVHKPIWHNCDCYSWMLHVGRFGAWRKGVVVHHAYREVASQV